jgi:aminopeptidase N
MMRGVAVLFLSVALATRLHAEEPRILGYDISVDWASSVTEAAVSVDAAFSVPDAADHLDLLFASGVIGVTAQAIRGSESEELVLARRSADSLSVSIPERFRGADSLVVRFRYAWPTEASAGPVYMSRGHRWYPMIADQIAPFRLKVLLPSGFTSVCDADLASERTAVRSTEMIWRSPIPVFKIELAMLDRKRFHEVGDGACRFITGRTDGEAVCRGATEEARFLSDLLGPSPFSRLTILELGEDPGTNIGSGLLVMGSPAVDEILAGHDDQLALGVAEQWLGAAAFPLYRSRGFWFLQLSLPHYLRLMFLRASQGDEAFQKAMSDNLSAYRRAASDGEVAILDVDMPNTRAKGAALYAKGPYVLDLVARDLGESRWREVLRDLYGTYRGRTMTLEDFFEVLKKYDASGKSVEHLRQMLSTTGIPEP